MYLDIGYNNLLVREEAAIAWENIVGYGLPELGASNLGNHSATKLSGARNYDAMVDVDRHGDFLSVQAAIDAGRSNIRVRKGTYLFDDDLVIPTGVSIICENKYNTIFDFQGNAKGVKIIGTSGSIKQNFVLKDLTIKNSNAVAGLDIDYCDFFTLDNVRATSCDQKGIRIRHSRNFILNNTRTDDNTGNGLELSGDSDRKQENFSLISCRSKDNGGIGFAMITAAAANMVDYSFFNCLAAGNTGDGYDFSGGNIAHEANIVGCNAETNGGNGFDIDARDCSFISCQSDSNTGDGFETSVLNNRLIGCSASGNGTNYDLNSSTIVIGNLLSTGVDSGPLNGYSETDLENIQSFGNFGENTRTIKRTTRMKNTSGSTINKGNVLTLKAASSGEETTTTTAQGDDLVYGMALADNIANNEYGPVLTEGYTTLLKVDGITDIAIGDLLGTSTTAGIAMKAGAGDMAFAIALEVYTANDNNGVINALIIKPRRVKFSSFNTNIVPTGTINGSNKDFTLPSTPSPTDSLKVYVNGVRQVVSTDYSLAGAVITMTIAPPTGSTILCDFTS